MSAPTSDHVARLHAERKAQGLPERISDSQTIAAIARILRAASGKAVAQ